MDTKTLTGSRRSFDTLGLRDDHPLTSARRLRKTLLTQVAVLMASCSIALMLGSLAIALIALTVACVFGAIGGGVALVRYRNGLDLLILDRHSPDGVPGLHRRIRYLTSPRLRRVMAGSLRSRPWVRDPRILAGYATLARRLEAPEAITAQGMLRLIAILQTAPSAVAVGSPDAVVQELCAISYLFECQEPASFTARPQRAARVRGHL
jgi:hypothetical protein